MASRAGKDMDKSDALARMDLVKILRAYISTISSVAPGYKALLLDKETMQICSTMYGRTELAAEFNVVHIERIDDMAANKEHQELKALVFIRPTRENITLFKRELRAPRYQSYHVYFTNLLSQIHVQDLAEADAMKETIAEVQEFYGDFCAVDSDHFTVPVQRNELLICPKASPSSSLAAMEFEFVDRCVQGLSALFLAVRRRPVIRFQKGSDHAQKLADSLYSLTYKQQYQVFDFGARGNPIVLIVDRKDDPVTPLLTQWTYQAMIHELVGLRDGRVMLTSSKIPQDMRDVVLDPRSDEFYRKHMYANFGEVGVSVKALLEQYQSTESKHKQVESLDDIRRFLADHHDFTRLQSHVTKHVNLMSELSEAVSKRSLMDVSEMEQELANPATNVTAASSVEDIMRIMRQPNISDKDRIRLAMLYALRFEADTMRVRQLIDYLVTAGVKDREPRLFGAIDAVLKYAGAAKRSGDLYASRSIMNKAMTMFKGLQGVDNVYTQHSPLLTATLTDLSTDKLDVGLYPFMASSQDESVSYQQAFRRTPPREVIVFVIGGTTLEEGKAVHEWNERNPHMRVVLGGTALLNSDAFLSALTAQAGSDATAIDIR